MSPGTRVLIFDGECGFCTWAAEWVERRLPSGAGIVPWQLVEDLSAYGLTERDVSTAAYWIDARGRAHRGHRAMTGSLVAIGGGWGLLGRIAWVPPFSWIAAGTYEVVARNRRHLPGTTPACKRTQ